VRKFHFVIYIGRSCGKTDECILIIIWCQGKENAAWMITVRKLAS
jgi:hypothetical protein